MERLSGAPPSRMKGILEAIAFAKRVLGITGLDACINRRRCMGVAAGTDMHMESNPLSVAQLKILHETLRSDEEPWDKAFAGMVLLCAYAETNMGVFNIWNVQWGSQDCKSHAIASSGFASCRRVNGIVTDPWGEDWISVRNLLGIQSLKMFPLMPSPDSNGDATVRPLNTAEAKAWMHLLLRKNGCTLEG